MKFFSFPHHAVVMSLAVLVSACFHSPDGTNDNSGQFEDTELPSIESHNFTAGSTFHAGQEFTIIFSEAVDKESLLVQGDLSGADYVLEWGKTEVANDTLTIFPSSSWPHGEGQTLKIDVKDLAGNSLESSQFSVTIDALAPEMKSVSPDETTKLAGDATIVFLFSESMDVESLIVSGAISSDGYEVSWTNGENANDTLSIQPTGAWTGGVARTILIDAKDIAGNAMAAQNLSYDIDATTPTVVLNTVATKSSISAVAELSFIFSESMDPDSTVVTGALGDETSEDNWSWSTTTHENDSLNISPTSQWSDGENRTLVIGAKDIVGNRSASHSVEYTVDSLAPTVTKTLPGLTGSISVSQEIVVHFSETMDPNSVMISGNLSLDTNIANFTWSQTTSANDTLSITPTQFWTAGNGKVLTIDAQDPVGNNLATHTLDYTVDDTVPGISISHASETVLAPKEDITVYFTESMDIASLAITGSLANDVYELSWGDTDVANDTLTIHPINKWTTSLSSQINVSADDLVGHNVSGSYTYTVNILGVSSSTGASTNPGTRAKPIKSLQTAVDIALERSINNIHLRADSFSEGLVIDTNSTTELVIEGGYNALWNYGSYFASGYQSSIAKANAIAPYKTVSITGNTPVTFRNLIIYGSHTSTTPSSNANSSYAVYALNADVTIENSRVVGAKAQPGLDGTSAGNATQSRALAGRSGTDAGEIFASCNDTTFVSGGSGRGTGPVAGGNGGSGGTMDTLCSGDVNLINFDPSPGQKGMDAVTVGTTQGMGGSGGALDCDKGQNGANGLSVNGVGGSAGSSGDVVNNLWHAVNAQDGSLGQDGGGGGGGGGASGCDTGIDEYGASGGGGGAGGVRAGSFGHGGASGGSSFAIFAIGSKITATDSQVFLNSGGNGGNGGDGGLGQPGGNGAPGGAGIDGGDGGRGGDGANGGDSGAGGGGAGGNSYGIFSQNGTLTTSNIFFLRGTVGIGGTGGLGGASASPDSGVRGQAGSDGSVANIVER